MKNIPILTLLAILLASCTPASTPAPISTTTDTPLPTATLTPEPTATFTPEPTATPELVDVQVLALWDYNGNGVFDKGEPPLEGIAIIAENNQCITESDGTCALGQFQEGATILVSVSDPINNMGYFFPDTD